MKAEPETKCVEIGKITLLLRVLVTYLLTY